jgi:hypothetical protein
MSNPVAIRVGNINIGEVSVQGDQVRGEGGPFDPRLMFPVSVTLQPRPERQAFTLLDVTGSLHPTGTTPSGANRIGPAVTVPLAREQMRFRTFPQASQTQGFELRIPLTPPLVAMLEAQRHASVDKVFRAVLHLLPTIGWLYETGNSFGRDRTPDGPMGELDVNLGMYSRFALLWTTHIEDLTVEVPASSWVELVLPGLGLDKLRLLEVVLPSASNLVPAGVVASFDGARRDYDLGDYRGCIEKCRYVRDALVGHLGATRDHRLGDIVADRRGLPADAPVRAFLNGVWRGWWDLTNAGHHVPAQQAFTSADAQACLMTAALILSYLGQMR